MGLSDADRKELVSLIKSLTRDPKIPVDLAHRIMPTQGNIEEFAYGLASGMVIGNFMALFQSTNSRELDRDEIVDLFSVMIATIPRLRASIIKHLDMR